MIDDDLRDELLDEDDDLETPYWTLQRVIYTIVILITLIAFLIYIFSPLLNIVFNPPPPLPITIPSERV